MKGPGALLVSQANSLNMMYTELARRAALNMGEYIEVAKNYLRLALKAQAQSRATIEALVALQNPPVDTPSMRHRWRSPAGEQLRLE